MKLNSGQIIGISIVVLSLSLIVFQATRKESSVTFYTPAEVYASPGKFIDQTFRVSGLVLKGTKVWNGRERDLRFRISDLQGHEFQVHYTGIPPDLFKEGQGVIIEGKMSSNPQESALNKVYSLEATLLMVKHSEVYDTKQDHAKIKEMKLLDSMLKK